MHSIIEQFRKELLEVALFADKTVQNYISCIYKYFDYAKEHFEIDPVKSQATHILQWLAHLKQSQISNSRLQHHQCALKSFFTFLRKLNIIEHNPTEALFPIRKVKSERNQPIHKEVAFKLLRSIDTDSWLGQRNFIIISLLWALGLRLNELTALKVGDFQPEYDPENKIGLLRIHGKGKKQRALFVVDKLYIKLLNYLQHPQSPKKKSQPLFPTQKGKAISGCRVQRMIHESAHKAAITERITPHILRHSFATEIYHQKVPLQSIQALMGHDSIAETAIYIHLCDELKQQALELITISGRLSWQQ